MKTILSSLLACLSCFGFFLAQAAEPAPAPGYHLVKKISLPGDGGWDYALVDSGARRLYVTHGDQVLVLDADSLELKGAITGLKGVHGVALAAGKGFISDGKDNAVDVFDLVTLKVTKEIKTGQNPDAIIFDPASGMVFAFNGKSSDATVIDPVKEEAVKTIPVGGKPEFAAADGKGFVYVNIEDKNEMLKIDAKKLKVKARWKLAPCEEPSALTIDAAGGRLFAGCHNKMLAVVNSATGKIVATPAIGSGVDAAWYDAGLKLVFSSNGDGTVSVVRQNSRDSYTPAETVTTIKGARTSALDPKTHRVFLASAEFGPAPEAKKGEHVRPPVIPGSFSILVLDR